MDQELLVRSAHVIRLALGATIAMVLGTFRRTAQCEVEVPWKSRGEGALELHQKGCRPGGN